MTKVKSLADLKAMREKLQSTLDIDSPKMVSFFSKFIYISILFCIFALSYMGLVSVYVIDY